jgi:hypothetical protein
VAFRGIACGRPLLVRGMRTLRFKKSTLSHRRWKRLPSYLQGHSGLSRASSRHYARASGREVMRSGTTFCAGLLGRSACSEQSPPDGRARGSQRSAVAGHAAASVDGQVPHAADRFACTRARRAAAARAVRSAGIESPVAKYISSGVCPRNAECGRTRLCSCT